MNAPERSLPIGNGTFDPLSGELSLDGRCVRLRPRTAALLGHLLTHPDRVVGKDELMQAVWPDVVVTEDSIVKCVKEIRQALGEPARDWIRTLPRQGYAFIGEPAAPPQSAPVPSADAPVPPVSETAIPQLRPPQALIARWRPLAAFAIAVATVVVMLSLPGWRSGQPMPERRMGPSIVVLPIANQTGDPSQDNAADDLTEAVTHALARSAGTVVIAPSTAFTYKGKPVDLRRIGSELGVRYVLEGTLRDEGGRRVLTAQLADATNAVQLWNERFAPSVHGAAPLRDLVAGQVATTLRLQLVRAEAELAVWNGDTPGTAQLLSQARALMRWGVDGSQDMARARAMLEEVVRQEPRSADAWAILAVGYLRDVRFSATREDDMRRAADAMEHALRLAPQADVVRQAEALLYYQQGRISAALAALDLALQLNPNNALALADRGRALFLLGRADEAFEPIERAMRLSPRDPQLPTWQWFTGMAHLLLGHDDQAVVWLSRGADGNPKNPYARVSLAGALGAAGRIDEARRQVSEIQRLRPDLTIARLRAAQASDHPTYLRQRERIYDGLRRAGMPE
ncbi:MAG TPA: winged helix-turn-helix domain-containing protein [Ramlibacter sp.]|nr:winged helix-turn-helix domain-containing protein [Ramlibacter sp.]